MKKTGILHADLSAHLARLGHGDLFLIVDCGFPVPRGVPVVDLRVVYGLPQFGPVFAAILDEVVIEHAVAAEELEGRNPTTWEVVFEKLGRPETVPHQELKQLAAAAHFAIRTAEDTPYSNVLLTAGLGFAV